MSDGLGVWLYGISRAMPPQALTGLTGLKEQPVYTIEEAGLVAVAGSVPLGEFGEEPLRRNLENLDWLAETARAHDSVVNAVAGAAPAVVPLRLATVYLDDERVRSLLVERRADFEAALDRLTGVSEWGVKGYADPDALVEPPADDDSKSDQAAGAGTAYLLRRRAQLSARQDAERNAASRADEIHTVLLRLAEAATRHPPQDPQLTGKRAWMVLNGAYLVGEARTEEFAAKVRALDAELPGMWLELTGPWPPYSFAGTGQVAR